MCGIAGIISLNSGSAPIDPSELRRIREAMIARGPDDSGDWVSEDARVGLAHRRLAIIDLSKAGAQPMHDPVTGCRITFNGEIYNYRELRSGLEERGCRFSTSSDTEVLLHAYAEHGEAMLPMLRGMFAFCIWDPRKRLALLARDPLGIKPLYVASAHGSLRFASQVKALLAGRGPIDTSPDPAARVGFFTLGSVPEPLTLYRGIRMFPAGSWAWVGTEGLAAPRAYFDLTKEIAIGEAMADETEPDDCLLEELRAGLAQSIASHLIADVPVGVFLSAGIDSSAITALACGPGGGQNQVNTLTITCPEFGGSSLDESPLAERIAELLGTNHRTVLVSEEDFKEDADRLFRAMDQPTIDGVNTYVVSKAAAAAGLKVVLSGVGGDELFAGYGYYRRIPRLLAASRLPASIPGLGKAMRMASGSIARMAGKAKSASLIEYGSDVPSAYLLNRALYMPWELPSVLDPETLRDGLEQLSILDGMRRTVRGIRSPGLQICALDMTYYLRNQLLRDSDWASMAHSIELRTPLVDAWLLRDLMGLRGRGLRATKSTLMKAASPEILGLLQSRKKTGFYVPIDTWMRSIGREHRGRGNAVKSWGKLVLERLVAP